MSPFESLEWDKIVEQFLERQAVSKQLIGLLEDGSAEKFAELAVGLNDPTGNYSANQHGLGWPILEQNRNSQAQITNLAAQFRKLKSGYTVPTLIKSAQILFLGISVGSEISCMINPANCWVTNTRTTWAHLVIEYNDNITKANEALMLYRTSDANSKMAYDIWADTHARLETSMTGLYEMGQSKSMAAEIDMSSAKYLWADAISNNLYDRHHADKP